jgi:hypothetical protein
MLRIYLKPLEINKIDWAFRHSYILYVELLTSVIVTTHAFNIHTQLRASTITLL